MTALSERICGAGGIRTLSTGVAMFAASMLTLLALACGAAAAGEESVEDRKSVV